MTLDKVTGLTVNKQIVAGSSVKIGTTTAFCAADIAGTIQFNSTSRLFEGCDGSAWKPLGGFATQTVTSTCYDPVCTATCPSGYSALSGAWGTYWGENIDFNGPTNGGRAWTVADYSYCNPTCYAEGADHPGWTVTAVCAKR